MLTVPLRSFYFIWIEHPRWGMQEGSCPASSASELALRSAVITPASKTDCTTFDMAWCTVGLCRAAGGAHRQLFLRSRRGGAELPRP